MDPLERVTVGYSTMCDMVQEIIGTERIMREGVKATDATLAHWEGERNAMMRALTYILAASGTARHRIGHAGHAYSADPYVSRYPLDNARERMIMEPVLTHLSEIMEFDHVITVHHGGTVTDGPRWLYAPDLHDEQLDSPSWSLLSGYTGAHGYRGPIMNNAEFIGGRLARDILDTPGTMWRSWPPGPRWMARRKIRSKDGPLPVTAVTS